MQIPLVIKVVDEGAVYPEPCCPSPYHAFPAALGIADKVFDGSNMGEDENGNVVDNGRLRSVDEVIAEISAKMAERGVTGRLGTWPVPTSMMFTNVCFEYAVAWLAGSVPQERGNVDYALIAKLCGDYTEELTGTRTEVELQPLSLVGRTYQSFVMALLDSITF